MSYQYPSTAAERKAAALLREKGWRVDEPTCPECHGWGYLGTFHQWVDGTTTVQSSSSTYTFGTRSCPNGCPIPVTYFYASQSWSETLEQNGWTLA